MHCSLWYAHQVTQRARVLVLVCSYTCSNSCMFSQLQAESCKLSTIELSWSTLPHHLFELVSLWPAVFNICEKALCLILLLANLVAWWRHRHCCSCYCYVMTDSYCVPRALVALPPLSRLSRPAARQHRHNGAPHNRALTSAPVSSSARR